MTRATDTIIVKRLTTRRNRPKQIKATVVAS
jgi:hypothetical protein